MKSRRPLLLAAALAVAPSVLPAQEYTAIWGSGPTDVWIAGSRQALHYDGRAWTLMNLGDVTVRALWGSGPADVWAVGDGGAILHWDGRAWSATRGPVSNDLVAVGGCSATDVYAIGQTDDEGRPPALLRWNGQLWTADSLTVRIRAAGLIAGCGNLTVVGYGYFDPRPDQRRLAGVVARRRANAWTLAGWDGRRVTDSVIGNVAWTGVSVRGATTLLVGRREGGETVLLTSAGATWRRVSPPTLGPGVAMPDDPLAFLTGDGSIVMLLGSNGFARYAAGRWTVTDPQAAIRQMTQAMQGVPQPAPGRQPTQQEMMEMAQRAQQMQQAMGDPTALAARMAALSFGSATTAWAPATGSDLYVLSSSGLVSRISGADGTVLLDPTCLNLQLAAQLPQCRATPIRQGGAAPTPAPAAAPGRSTLPTPTRRNKP